MVKKFLLGMLALLVAWVLVGRILPPSAARRDALAMLRAPLPPVAGRDGSDAMWLLDYDVPVQEQAKVAARFRTWMDGKLAGGHSEDVASPDPRESYPRFRKGYAEEWLCEPDQPDCLRVAREYPKEIQSEEKVQARALAAADRMLDFDGLRFSATPAMVQSLPNLGGQRRLMRTRLALQFVQGDREGAMARTCRDLAGWRRFGADSDMVIASMVAAAYVRQDIRLLGEMLAEPGPGESLPVACEPALAPTRDAELQMCLPMHGDFQSIDNWIVRFEPASFSGARRMFDRISMDRGHVMAVAAPAFAHYCSAAVLAAARADRSILTVPAPPARCTWWERVPDPLGCSQAETQLVDSKYADRRTDMAAELALLRTLLWLRREGGPVSQWPQALARRPASLGAIRPATVSPDGRTISIELLDDSRDKTFALPLQAAP